MSESVSESVPLHQDPFKLQFRLLPVLLVVAGFVLAASGYFALQENAIRQAANAQAGSFLQMASELELFNEAAGRYPTEEEGLAVLAEALGATSEGPLPVWLMDEWGRPIKYATVSEDAEMPFDLISRGANGVDDAGAGDDISWRKGFDMRAYPRHTEALWGVAGVLYFVVVLLFVVTWYQAGRSPAVVQ